jgi:polysaccharide export outer membrane protein
LEAIGLAGGPTEFAELGNVLILRKEAGRLQPIRVRLTDAVKGNPSERDLNEGLPTLQTGDTVIVP